MQSNIEIYQSHLNSKTFLPFALKCIYTVHSCVCILGDVEIGLMERNGQLEVEIIKARGLIMKPGSRGPPGD